MPKKKTKKENSDKDKNQEKEEILNELALRLKLAGSEEKRDEEKSEEVDVEDEDNEEREGRSEEGLEINFQDSGFRQFMQQDTERETPVLERIAQGQERPVFVPLGNQTQGAIPGEGRSQEDTQYVPSTEENNEPKYTLVEGSRVSRAERVDFSQAGRKIDIFPERQMPFSEQASEIKQIGFESPTQENVRRAERVDIIRQGRKSPFDREESQYEKYKPGDFQK